MSTSKPLLIALAALAAIAMALAALAVLALRPAGAPPTAVPADAAPAPARPAVAPAAAAPDAPLRSPVFGEPHSLPGGDLTVTPTAAPTAGAPATFRVVTGMTDVARAEVFVGTAWDGAAPATVVPVGRGAWEATITLPAPIAEHAVLVWLILTDGSVLETSTQAFRL